MSRSHTNVQISLLSSTILGSWSVGFIRAGTFLTTRGLCCPKTGSKPWRRRFWSCRGEYIVRDSPTRLENVATSRIPSFPQIRSGDFLRSPSPFLAKNPAYCVTAPTLVLENVGKHETWSLSSVAGGSYSLLQLFIILSQQASCATIIPLC